MVTNNSTNGYANSRFIVSSTAGQGNYTTIASAITAANALGAPQTIFIKPGTYTENLTLQPGINLTAWGSDSSSRGGGNCIIIGKLSYSSAGTVTIYGIELQTNSDYCVEVTGTAVSKVGLTNCYINCTNNAGIHITSSGAGAYISLVNCNGDIGTGTAYFIEATAGTIFMYGFVSTNTGASTTSNNFSGTSALVFRYSAFSFPISFTSSASATLQWVNALVANTAFITSSSGLISLSYCIVSSGTASCVVANSTGTFSIFGNIFSSSNASVLTGTGTGNVGFNTFGTGSRNISFSSFADYGFPGAVGAAPFVGSIGEQIVSFIPSASQITLTNNTSANITSISITAGTWDVSAIANLAGTITGTAFSISINNTSATLSANNGDQTASTPTVSVAASPVSLTVPSFRVTLTTTTTYYLVAQASFTVGTATAYGRISATRVG